jgi:AcrR family transcriptional regulator
MNQMVHEDGRKTRHAARRGEILSDAADYVVEHGLQDLSVRELAAGVGLSHRTLLYHFGTREQLLMEVLDVVRERDRARIAEHLQAADLVDAIGLLRTSWAYFASPEREPYVRVFHQVLALGLAGPPFDGWVRDMVASRVGQIAFALRNLGVPAERARPAATLVVAAFRGLQVHLLATSDRETTDAAFEELISALSTLLTRQPDVL